MNNGVEDMAEGKARPTGRDCRPGWRYARKSVVSSLVATKQFLPDPSVGSRLQWLEAPSHVFVIKKIHDKTIRAHFKQLLRFLVEEKQLSVTVEASVLKEKDILLDKQLDSIRERLFGWSADTPNPEKHLEKIDLIVCLGGDGTLLYASSLFQERVPPVLAFNFGSLGFLTPLHFDDHRTIISEALRMDGRVGLTMRSRFECTIRHSSSAQSSPSESRRDSCVLVDDSDLKLLNGQTAQTDGCTCEPQMSIITMDTVAKSMVVLNEVVIDRAGSPFLGDLEVYCNGQLVTEVQGDGLIVATPTGSTAYAAAAGASMVHPSVEAMIMTPICPHSLSFRPIMVPGGVSIKIEVPMNSRGIAQVSCDGRNRQPLRHGDSVTIRMSQSPVPCVNSVDHLTDWFQSLATCLCWNVRRKQTELHHQDDDHRGNEDNHGDEDG